MIVRQARKSDVEQIVQIYDEIIKVHTDNRPEIFKKKSKINIKKEITKILLGNEQEIYVASDEKEIVYGIIIFKIKKVEGHNNLKNARTLWINDIGVKKEYRKSGIGKMLMIKVEELAKENNYSRIELNCWGFNKNAIDFYKKLGMNMQRIIFEK